jgi:hypothetical protein
MATRKTKIKKVQKVETFPSELLVYGQDHNKKIVQEYNDDVTLNVLDDVYDSLTMTVTPYIRQDIAHEHMRQIVYAAVDRELKIAEVTMLAALNVFDTKASLTENYKRILELDLKAIIESLDK